MKVRFRKWHGEGSEEERIHAVLRIAHADIFVNKLEKVQHFSFD